MHTCVLGDNCYDGAVTVAYENMTNDPYLAAVPAPCATSDTENIEGNAYYIYGFDREVDRDDFIKDVKEQMDLDSRAVTRIVGICSGTAR